MEERQFGNFRILRQLGLGGMGVVYLAKLPTDDGDRTVALKVLSPGLSNDPKLLRRFEREIKILKRLRHPNIVRYYGGGTHDGQRFYAMEFIDGGTIQDLLRKRRQLTVEQAIEVGRQLCAALEHAHNAGVIHRDLKPANLFLARSGRLKLGDFGIARDTEATALTAAGKTVGTYAYMAPEQIHGGEPITGKTDLYAAGCVLFEVLTGEAPFSGDNPAEMLMQHLNDDPRNVRDLVPDCPIWLDELIERMLAKKPEDRPYDALAVHTELTEIRRRLRESTAVPTSVTAANADVSTQPGGPNPEIARPKVRKKKKRKRDAGQFYEQTWFLVTCLILVLGAGYWLSRPPGEETLYLKARAAMESRDETAQREAREDYMLPYLERFPDGQFAEEMQRWKDDVQVDVLLAQAEKKLKGGREPRNDLEGTFIAARAIAADSERHPLEYIEALYAFERQLQAWSESPDSLPADFLEDADSDQDLDPKERIRDWTLVVRRELDAAREQLLNDDKRDAVIAERMAEAEAAWQSGERETAVPIWVTFREVFYGVRDVEAWYTYARRRANGESHPLPEVGLADGDAGEATGTGGGSADGDAKVDGGEPEADAPGDECR